MSKKSTHQPRMTKGHIRTLMKALEPLQTKLEKPEAGSWRAEHVEKHQTFEKYAQTYNHTPSQNVIYVVPLGPFSPANQKIFDLTRDFIGLYFGLQVKTLAPIDDSCIPPFAQRINSDSEEKQYLSTYVLDELLIPRIKDLKDAAALLALTSVDLWPGKGWNFVFGQANIIRKVGVWSNARHGDPEHPAEFSTCLLRSLKTATHETGHTFMMSHCLAFECNMNGSNHLEESDSRMLELCSECFGKLCYAARFAPLKRCSNLAKFCFDNGLKTEGNYYKLSEEVLRAKLCVGEEEGARLALEEDDEDGEAEEH